MNYLDMVARAAIDITVEVMPERLVFVTFVPSASVLGALFGGLMALARRLDGERRALWAEMGALLGGVVGTLVFVCGFLLEEVV
ncbi:MAG TPA: hypothetical protein VEW67_08230 [Thermoleophilaceae bacterium]|nr:hypothetical protein [Thermoleophilaceae bacterium]